jgi:hypothetical protein
LARVNLIAGKNNTGKTSLLEAIHLHSYPQDCQLPFSISELRGIEVPNGVSESLVIWLFFDRKTKARIMFVSQDDKGITRELQIAFGDGQEVRQQFPDADSAMKGSFLENDWKTDRRRIVMKSEQQGKTFFAGGLLMPTGLASLGSKQPWEGPSSFLSSWRDEPDKDVLLFSNFERDKRQEEILPGLHLLEPALKRLSIVVSDNRPAIHADIGLSQLIPVALMGEGFRRLLKILLYIASARGGRVLIDEIENGFHYSVLQDIWKAIGHAAGQANVQVFATTHSWECIHWAREAFSEAEENEFRLFRLNRLEDRLWAAALDRQQIDDMVAMGVEVR